jgi:hypothetical protein
VKLLVESYTECDGKEMEQAFDEKARPVSNQQGGVGEEWSGSCG